MRQKGFAPLIILVLIVLSATIYLGYKVNWQKIHIILEKTLIELNLAPNQKIYTNNKFGFQISYPGDWLILKGADGVMWYKSDSKSELDLRILRMSWHNPGIIYELGVRCDKNETCQEVDRITTSDKTTIINIWKPTEEGKKYIGSEYLGFIENSDRAVVPSFATDFDDIQTFKNTLSTFKFTE